MPCTKFFRAKIIYPKQCLWNYERGLKTAIKLQHFGDGRFIDSGLKEWKISTGQTGNQPRLFNRDAWLFGLDQTGGNCHNRTVPTTTWGFCIWVMSINRYNLYVKDIYLAVIQMLMRCSWNGHEPHKKCWHESAEWNYPNALKNSAAMFSGSFLQN